MTFWVTLWYAGAVVMTMGYEGMTEGECKNLGEVIMKDIAIAYMEQPEEMMKSVFPKHEFKVTCETTRMEVDEKYKE